MAEVDGLESSGHRAGTTSMESEDVLQEWTFAASTQLENKHRTQSPCGALGATGFWQTGQMGVRG